MSVKWYCADCESVFDECVPAVSVGDDRKIQYWCECPNCEGTRISTFNVCAKCGTVYINDNEVLCESCMEQFLSEYGDTLNKHSRSWKRILKDNYKLNKFLRVVFEGETDE